MPTEARKIRPEILIFAVAFILRGLHLAAMQPMLAYEHFFNESVMYFYAAGKLAHHQMVASGFNVVLSPVYLFYLVVCELLFGHSAVAPRVIQILLGSVTCVLLYRAARYVVSETAALTAGFLAAGSALFIYFDNELMKPCLMNFFLVFGTLFFFRGLYKKSTFSFVLAGFFYLSAAWLRLHLLLILLVAIPFVFVNTAGEIRNKLFKMMALAAGILAGVLFWNGLFYLCFSYQKQVGISTSLNTNQAGLHAYIGNQPGAAGKYRSVEGVAENALGHFRDARHVAEQWSGREMDGAEVNHFWLKKTIQSIYENPFSWVKSQIQKIFLLMNQYEIPSKQNFYAMQFYSRILALPLVTYGWIFPLGIAALFGFGATHDSGRKWIKVFVITYIVALLITFISADYRLPLHPFLMLATAMGLDEFLKKIKAGDWLSLRRPFIIFVIIFFISQIQMPVTKIISTNSELMRQASVRQIFLKGISEDAIIAQGLEGMQGKLAN